MAKSREKFDYNGFYESVRKKKFSPVYFFYGEERFLLDECVDAIIEHAVDPGMKEFNFDVLQGSEMDANRVLAIAASYPMMADRRVMILKEFERTLKKGTEEMYAHYFENPSPTTVMVIVANSPDFRKKPYTTLKAHAVVGEFRPYYENETIAWIESRVKKFRRTIEPTAAALLHSYVGSSLRELANEIEKLTIAAGDTMTISAADVEHVVGVSREFTAFELANKIGEKNIAKSLEIADRLIRSGDSAVAIIAALTIHFIKLYKLHDAVRQRRPESELAKVIGVHSFFMKEYMLHLKKYTPAEIEQAFLLLSEADLAVKSSSDQNRVLTKVIAEIINGTPRVAESA
jgi:DNA polymerase-3 subunit delta